MSQWLGVCPVLTSHPYLTSYLAVRASLCQRQHRQCPQVQITLCEACGGLSPSEAHCLVWSCPTWGYTHGSANWKHGTHMPCSGKGSPSAFG